MTAEEQAADKVRQEAELAKAFTAGEIARNRAALAAMRLEWWPPSNRNAGRHQVGIHGQDELESATSPPPRPKTTTMPPSRNSIWPHDSNETAFGETGTLHSSPDDRCFITDASEAQSNLRNATLDARATSATILFRCIPGTNRHLRARRPRRANLIADADSAAEG